MKRIRLLPFILPPSAFILPAGGGPDLLEEGKGSRGGGGVELPGQEQAQLPKELDGGRVLAACRQRFHQRPLRALPQWVCRHRQTQPPGCFSGFSTCQRLRGQSLQRREVLLVAGSPFREDPLDRTTLQKG